MYITLTCTCKPWIGHFSFFNISTVLYLYIIQLLWRITLGISLDWTWSLVFLVEGNFEQWYRLLDFFTVCEKCNHQVPLLGIKVATGLLRYWCSALTNWGCRFGSQAMKPDFSQQSQLGLIIHITTTMYLFIL